MGHPRGPRKPRDMESYMPVAESVAQLRRLADHVERTSSDGVLMKWSIDFRYWNPAWEKPAKKDVA